MSFVQKSLGFRKFLKKCVSIREYGNQCVVSMRKQAWLDSQEKYKKYAPYIIYSSHVEKVADEAQHFTKTLQHDIHKTSNKIQNEYFSEVLTSAKEQYISASLKPAKKFDFPKNWLNDYEFYEESVDEDGNIYGTADAAVPGSIIPCSGCGANLHCANTSLPGYIPKEIFFGRSNKELQTIICQRCHFLKNYNIALDIEVTPKYYENTISTIKDKFALAIVIIDLLDMPCSIWPGLQDILGTKRPVFIVGNKVDLLPRDSNNYLDHIKSVLEDEVAKTSKLNIKHICLASAKTGYGIEELITQLQKIWKYKGDVYLVGCTNVGKSSLFNILLNSDYCRPDASSLVRKATACPWPGTTLKMLKFPIYRPSAVRLAQRFQRLFSERAQKLADEKLRFEQARKMHSTKLAKLIGKVGNTFVKAIDDFDSFAMSSGTQPVTTLNEKHKDLRLAKWCHDTPGVLHPDQITNLLTTEELLKLQSHEMLSPRAYRLSPGMSIFLGGLARLDFLHCNNSEALSWIQVFVFSSLQLPIVITELNIASDMYQKYLGTNILGSPFGDEERLRRWPGLQAYPDNLHVVGRRFSRNNTLTTDVVLSSAGWIGISIPEDIECQFKAWTPYARGIYLRNPLVPNAQRLIGKYIRNSLAYNLGKPFVFRK